MSEDESSHGPCIFMELFSRLTYSNFTETTHIIFFKEEKIRIETESTDRTFYDRKESKTKSGP